MAMHIIIQWQKNEERRENTTTRGNMRPRRGKEAMRERRIHEKKQEAQVSAEKIQFFVNGNLLHFWVVTNGNKTEANLLKAVVLNI